MKKLLFIIIGVIIVIALALVIFINTIDFNKYKPLVEEQVRVATGLEFSIEGDIGIAFFPFSIELSGLRLKNNDTFKATAADLLYVERANAGLKLMPLLAKRIEITNITLTGVNAELIKNRNGIQNWDFSKNKAAAPVTATVANTPGTAEDTLARVISLTNSLSFNEIALKNSKVTYRNLDTNTSKTIAKLDLAVGPFNQTSDLTFTLTGEFNGLPLSVKGNTASLAKILQDKLPFDMAISMGGDVTANLKGTYAAASATPIEAIVDVNIGNIRNAFKSVLGSVPAFLANASSDAFKSVKTSQTIKMAKDGVISFNGPITFDKTTGNLHGTYSGETIKNIAITFNGDQITLDTYLPPKAAKGSSNGSSSASAVSKQPILNADTFGKLNILANIKLNTLTYKDLSFAPLTATVKLNQGLAAISFNANAGAAPINGQFNGNLIARNSQKEFKFTSNSLEIAPFVKMFTGSEMARGALNANIDVYGTGMDVSDMLHSLTGKVLMDLNQGRFQKGSTGINFDKFVLNLDFKGGNGTVTTGTLTGNVISATITGAINLANSSLNLVVTPKAMPLDTVNALFGSALPTQAPFSITGTFSDPKIGLAVSAQDILETLTPENIKKTIDTFDSNKIKESVKGTKDSLKEGLTPENVMKGLNDLFQQSPQKQPAE